MQLPDPTPEKKMDDRTGKVVHADVTEFQRRSKYLTKFSQIPGLINLVEQCLQDAPRDRPPVEEVIEWFKNAYYNHLPHENDSIIELFDSLIQCEEELQELRLREKGNNDSGSDEEFSFIDDHDYYVTECPLVETQQMYSALGVSVPSAENRFDQVYIRACIYM